MFVLGLYLSPRLQAQDVTRGIERNAARCGTDDLLKAQLKKRNMSIDEYLSQMRGALQANNPAANHRLAQDEIITIPVVVHLIYHPNRSVGSNEGNLTDCHVHTAIEVLNKTFAQTHGLEIPREFASAAAGDTRIRFELATRDPDGNPTTGITRYPIPAGSSFAQDLKTVARRQAFDGIHNQVGPWNTSRYLNVYVYPESPLGGLLGAATYPSVFNNTNQDGSDFVLMNSRAFFSPSSS